MTAAGPVMADRYEIGRLLHRTAISDDFVAHDSRLDRPVTVKVLRSELVRDRTFIERLRQHALTAANLTHPGVAQVLDWGRDADGFNGRPGPTFFIVSEQPPGRALDELVRRNGPMPVDRALHVAAALTSVLGYGHRTGVVHGGLRPELVTIGGTGVVRVADLHLELALGPTWQPPDDRPDLAMWRAPEQGDGQPADERTDVYQLGLLLYLMATGRPPFPGETASVVAARHANSVPPAPSKVNPLVPRPLEAVIGRSLAKNANERFASIADQRAALIRYRESRRTDTSRSRVAAATIAEPRPLRPIVPVPLPAEDAAAGDEDATQFLESGDTRSTPAALTHVDPFQLRADASPLPDADDDLEGGRIAEVDDAFGETEDDFGAQTQLAGAAARPRPAIASTPTLGTSTAVKSKRLRRADRKAKKANRPEPHTWPLALLLLALLGILGGMLWIVSRQLSPLAGSGDIVVPNVTEASYEQAQVILQAQELEAFLQPVEGATSAPDIVFEQDPAAGSRVRRGSRVTLRFAAAGNDAATIPDLLNRERNEARSVLLQAGLRAEFQDVETDTAPTGTVIGQDPKAGAPFPPDRRVVVQVAVSAGTVEIPDVSGKDPAAAQQLIRQLGVRHTVQSEASPTVESGKVTRTEPPAGTRIAREQPIVIFVSSGRTEPVPSLLGQTEAEATKRLTDAGLIPDRLPQVVADPAQIGIVVAQSPLPGTEVEPGGTVVIRVGVGGVVTVPSTAPPTSNAPAPSVAGQSDLASTTTTAASSQTTVAPTRTTVAATPAATAPATPAPTPPPTAAPPTAAPTAPPTPAPTAAPTVPTVPETVATAPPVTAAPPAETTPIPVGVVATLAP